MREGDAFLPSRADVLKGIDTAHRDASPYLTARGCWSRPYLPYLSINGDEGVTAPGVSARFLRILNCLRKISGYGPDLPNLGQYLNRIWVFTHSRPSGAYVTLV